MRRALVIVTAFLTLLLAGSAAWAARVIKVGIGADGKAFLLKPGDVIVVSLPGNATTGYSWKVKRLDRNVAVPAGSKYIPRKTRPPRVGAGGTFVLRFRAVGVGNSALRLVYVRGGRLNARPAKTFGLTLHVPVS